MTLLVLYYSHLRAVGHELAPQEAVHEEHLHENIHEAEQFAEPVLEDVTVVHLKKKG